MWLNVDFYITIYTVQIKIKIAAWEKLTETRFKLIMNKTMSKIVRTDRGKELLFKVCK